MAKTLDRLFDEFTGALPVKEEPRDTLKTEAATRFAPNPKRMKREWMWLRMLEQLHAARASV